MLSNRWLAPRSRRFASILLCGLAAVGVAARAEPPIPPAAVRAEARRLLAELIAIDTTQAGSTAPAVDLLAAHLRAAGFGDDDLWIVGPRAEKRNLVVRLRGAEPGRAKKKPILFLSHLDVVAARREDWTVPPFELTEANGFLYGRGTLDIKGEVVDLVVNFARLKREGFVPDRDLYLALTADEEEGDANGVAWLLAERHELLDVAYAINTDAAGLQQQNGRLERMPIQTSEKIYLSFELETTSAGGHSAFPTFDNAIYRLAAALRRLDGLVFPVALSPTTRMYFERLAANEEGDLGAAFRGVLADPPEPAAVAKLSSIPWYNAALRTLCTPTLLSAGDAENALPQHARATLQCRLLPEDDPADVREALVERIADPRVSVTPKAEPVLAAASPIEPELFAAVEAVTESCWPGVPVLPVMDPWASDGALLRRAGISVYGISGIYFDIDDVRSHGEDERIAVAAFEQGLEFMHRLMRRLGGASQ
jgi:acetylornithine deacetylase/succinyl-diaminopimelate desuccinylase-like protein